MSGDGIPPERPPERPSEIEPCPDCGYPIDACECASLFADDPLIPDGDLAGRAEETAEKSDTGGDQDAE